MLRGIIDGDGYNFDACFVLPIGVEVGVIVEFAFARDCTKSPKSRTEYGAFSGLLDQGSGVHGQVSEVFQFNGRDCLVLAQ